MSEKYHAQIKTIEGLNLFKIFWKWNGSIFKLVWFEMVLFSCLYLSITLMYRFVLFGIYKEYFEKFCIYCDNLVNIIPISFILGFYVSMIVTRWWIQFKLLPWPDDVAFLVNSCITGNSHRVLMLRYNIIRYINATLVFFYRSVSMDVKKLLPTEEDVMYHQILNYNEYKLFDRVNSKFNRYHIPSLWATKLACMAYNEKFIKSEIRFQTMIVEIGEFRNKLNRLFMLNWINPPLVYTQTTSLAIYIYFTVKLFSNQFLTPSKNYPGHNVDFYIPIFSLIQLIFYFGWLKIGEALINPFGTDDDDFQCIDFIRRNLSANFPILKLYEDMAPNCVPDKTINDDPCLIGDIVNDENLARHRKKWRI